jgi:hypothetical protein
MWGRDAPVFLKLIAIQRARDAPFARFAWAFIALALAPDPDLKAA